MSGLDSLHTLLEEELKDIYDAGKQLTKALPKMTTNASAAELKSAFENYLRQTQEHVERIEQENRCSSGSKCRRAGRNAFPLLGRAALLSRRDRWRFLYGEIRQEGIAEGRTGDARAQAGHAALGGLRQEGDEPKAGHRDRSERSTPSRWQGSAEARRTEEEQEIENLKSEI